MPDVRETASYALLEALGANAFRLGARHASIQDYPAPTPQRAAANVPTVVLRDTKGLNLQIRDTHVVLLADRDDGIIYCERDAKGLKYESAEPIQLAFNDRRGEFEGIADAGGAPPAAVEGVLRFVARKLSIQLGR